MKIIKVIGIDLAKEVFHLYGIDGRGRCTLNKKVRRNRLKETISQIEPSLIGMEACGGAHHWAREFREMGHEVKLMAPQYVKAYVKTNKNDRNDAEAICEAVTRPNMRFVKIKSEAEQSVLMLHRIREQLMRQRVALSNMTRGILLEFGISIARHPARFKQRLVELMSEMKLNAGIRQMLVELYEQYLAVEQLIECQEKRLEAFAKESEACQRLMKIPGVGLLSASALLASVGDARQFKNGRQMSAWLGLVPRQHSSGGKTRLLGISKRGDKYLRKLFVHGARATLRWVENKKDPRSQWIQKKITTRGVNKTCVAIANKNVRIMWALLTKNEAFQPAA
jgi:transposase